MKKGIQYVKFYGLPNKDVCLSVFVHQYGGLMTNLPTGQQFLIWNKTQTMINVDHEIMEVLDYKGKQCHEITNLENYDLRGCQDTESYKVSKHQIVLF